MSAVFIIPNTRSISSSMKESKSSFLCPSNTVMTGRYHTGDENGQTEYEYSTLKAIDSKGNVVSGTITIEDVKWDRSIKESAEGYNAPTNRVIVGRQHDGDENGQTKYATAIVKFNGKPTYVNNTVISQAIKESAGVWFKSSEREVITGRQHLGDENKNTFYYTGVITTQESSFITRTVKGYTTKEEYKTDVVGMYPDENSDDHYISGLASAAIVYKLTYNTGLKEGDVFSIATPNCGYASDPVTGGALWRVSRGYRDELNGKNEIIFLTFVVKLNNKWFPCKPEEVQWTFLANMH